MDLELRDRLDNLFNRIEVARKRVNNHHIVKIVAVTKYTNSEVVKKLYELGQRAFGENKVKELKKKSSELQDLPLEWHFIGNLQKNKINKIISLQPSLFQSLSSLDLAEELNSRLETSGKKIDALLQINASREPQKGGILPEYALDSYKKISDLYPNINLKGVMAMAKDSENIDEVRKNFRETRELFDKLDRENAKICSMGMSGDFEIAIEEGSNLIRVGSVLVK